MRLKIQKFEEANDPILDTIYEIADSYTKELDSCIDEVQNLLKNKDDLTIEQLNYYISYIPIILYNLSDRLQDIGILTDSAKMQRKEVYNAEYQSVESGTVAYKTSIAQRASQEEQTVEDIYSRVYKRVEDKMERAEMLHSSLKKVLQWRVSELEVTRTNVINVRNRRMDNF